VAKALLARGNTAGALRCVAQARALPHPDPAWFDLVEADIHIAAGDHAAARVLATIWTDDPAFGPPARERLARLPAPPAPPAPPPLPLWRRALSRLRG